MFHTRVVLPDLQCLFCQGQSEATTQTVRSLGSQLRMKFHGEWTSENECPLTLKNIMLAIKTTPSESETPLSLEHPRS